MDYAIQNWLEHENFDEFQQSINNRPVYIWGAYPNGKGIRVKLSQHEINVEGYIDGHKGKTEYDSLPVVLPDQLNLRKNPYIIIAVIGVRAEIIDYLNSFGMTEKRDYIYVSGILPQYTISSCGNSFKDIYGNEIIVDSPGIKCNIEIVGYNNKIHIGKQLKCHKKTRIRVENGSRVTIGNYVQIEKEVEVIVTGGGSVQIGNNCWILRDSRLRCKGAKMLFGNYVTTGKRFFGISGKTSSVEIGNDCMFSNDVSVMASSGHDIFDLSTKENKSLKEEKEVKIGNHVWLGKNATILYNSEINDGCIVGANSLVKLKAQPNSVIAGNPARVIKTGCTWDRRFGIGDEEI